MRTVSDHLMAEINQAVMEKQLNCEPYTIIWHWNDEGEWVADSMINKTPECLFDFRNAARINRELKISSIDTLFLLESSSADYNAYVFNKKTALFIQKVDTIHSDSISHYYLIRPYEIESKYNKLYHHIIEWDTAALSLYKYNPKVLGEFYNWYLTRVCIENGHICDVDFFILPDHNFWHSACTLGFNKSSTLAWQTMSGYDEKYVADVRALLVRGMLTGTVTRMLGDNTAHDYDCTYQYDLNGNMTRDRNKGIYSITYSVLNLPSEILYADGNIVRYKYAADGRKLQTRYILSNIAVVWDDDLPIIPINPAGGLRQDSLPTGGRGGGAVVPMETTLMVRDYCGSHIYRDSVLERINNDYGYWAGGNWYYYIKDYQGNVRAVIGHAGNLVEVNNYYPYGALMGGGTVGNNPSVQPYKYGTKELDRQNGLDWYDSQARHYDPLLGRTPTMDALAEKYYSISPYAWCAGNPINYIDPNGKNPIYNQKGVFIGTTNEGFTDVVLIYMGNDCLQEELVKNLSKDEFLEQYMSITLDEAQDQGTQLSDDAYSNIWSHIASVVSNYEEMSYLDFSLNKIEGSKIQYVPFSEEKTANFSTYPYRNRLPRIEGTASNTASYESTVENLASTILVHEWYGHVVKRYSGKSHYKAYELVKNSPLWERTTAKYKKSIEEKILLLKPN